MDMADNATDAETSEAQRLLIKQCIEVLLHACSCSDENCRLSSCQKMKRVVSHTKVCRRNNQNSCAICKQFGAICCYHAKNCTEESEQCLVPFCTLTKQRLHHYKQRELLMGQSISPSQRSHANELLLKTMSPLTDSINHQSTMDNTFFAKKLESNIYDHADTPTDYYRLLAVKKWEIEIMNEEKYEIEREWMDRIEGIIDSFWRP